MDNNDTLRGRGSMQSRSESYLPNYQIGKAIGIGSFGKVRVAQHVSTGYKVAVKILSKRKIKMTNMEEKVTREIKILKLFMHPHIIRLYEAIDTPADIFLVMEHVNNGELFDYIVEKGRLSDDEARRFFQQIISGVEYCHRNMVVHRDLKPENLLLDSEYNVKIADFGLSNVMYDGHFLKTSCGSPNYAAPEVISGKLYAGPEVDVWSCGVILYALLCGSLPFDDENIPNLFKKIKDGIYTLPSHLSAGAKDLILRMLLVDPLKRITIPEIKQHPWFRVHLPRYLAVPPEDISQQVKRVDEDIVQEVIRLGFSRKDVIESLQARIQNEASVAYYLIFDNSHHISNGYLGANLTEAMTDYEPETQTKAVNLSMHDKGSPTAYMQTERKWSLGLQSRAHPRMIMVEVLKALQELEVTWKKIGHYNIRCRWLPPPPLGKEGDSLYMEGCSASTDDMDHGVRDEYKSVKFEIQLYKMAEDKYLLDIQRVQGPQFLFVDLCALFLAELNVL
ncbi:hypothetical protein KP509_37G045000 [Ceratopteris richardii]|uniref:non-specific serine/threonine protein kinase n=3 Tax=Ceratopteris richardii TaxID=49495 RepID=A0A8T2Q8G4_CERRI|nr:hypothetical protein KP509_37G045000 [Ceratopteris richardii]KAH7279955.1 hypothetical protein KP509_37G045000 [Ceratopteris richardii]KAH7279956.1 hypothetical protein KP509_37G045000 [Ceratopteris richardii]KAH7279959.1 hypothetical protein KP509_37G045000 [Ceratopteris richardii]